MTAWEIAVSAVGSFLAYGLAGLWVGVGMYNAIWDRYYDHVDRTPERHNRNRSRYETGQCDCHVPDSAHEISIMSGLIWPVAVWIVWAQHVIRRQNQRRWERRQSEAKLASFRRELEQL